MMDPLLLFALALLTAFVLGRASARSTWRRIAEARNDMATFEELAQRWRQREAPLVADWPTELPEGSGMRKLTTRVVEPAPTQAVSVRHTSDRFAARHRRYVWVGFWAGTSTPRDPQARIAAAMQRADSVTPLPEALRVLADLAAPACAATAGQALEATWGPSRELVGVA